MQAIWLKRMALKIGDNSHEYFTPYRKRNHERNRNRNSRIAIDPLENIKFNIN